MLSEDVNIQYMGFEPSADMKSRLYYLLNQLHLKSPSKSLMTVTFTLTNGIFEGAVKITSITENFVARATDVQMPALGTKLVDKAFAQLDKWKSLRFDK